jgi:hypothetical protein
MTKYLFLLAALPSTAFAGGATIDISGECAGSIFIDVSYLTPNGRFAILSSTAEGDFEIPGGICAGAPMGLDGDSIMMLGRWRADSAGLATFNPTISDFWCGRKLAVLDLTTCIGSNRATIPVPATEVYEINIGSVPLDTEVTVNNLMVTGTTQYGFFAQDSTNANSGIYVYLGADWDLTYGNIVIGDVVNASGTYIEYNGLAEIDLVGSASPSIDFVDTGMMVEPVVLGVGQLDLNAEAYESMIIEVQNVEVDNEDLGYGEWSVTDGFSSIRVNDLMYAASPAPVLNQTYLSITGALNYSFGEFKIEPRSSDDIVPAP